MPAPHRIWPVLFLLASTASAQEWVNGVRCVPTTEERNRVIARGDAEDDGDVDLVALCEDPNCAAPGFQVVLNEGSNAFSDGPLTPIDPTTWDFPRDMIRFGDVTGDDLADVVLVFGTPFSASSPGGAFVYESLGGGAFAAPVTINTDGRPEDVELGDVDGNGVLDIALVHHLSTTGSHFTWYTWNGSGVTPSSTLTLTAGTNGNGTFEAHSLEVVDFDRNGSDDLIVSERNEPSIWVLPTVAGNPTLGSEIPLPALDPSEEPPMIVRRGDLETDGDQDLLVFGQIVEQTGVFTFDTDQILYLVENAAASSLVVLGRQVIEDYFVPVNRDPKVLMHLTDWDGDGDADLGTMGNLEEPKGGFSRGPGFYLFENDGQNAFEIAASVNSISFDQAVPGPADFNLDGRMDFATADGIRFGNGTFASAQEIFPGNVDHPEYLRDFEDDGDLDPIDLGAGVLYENDGTGTFTRRNLWPDALPFFLDDPVAYADFDGDGLDDFLVGLFSGGGHIPAEFVQMRLARNNGLGTFVNGGQASPNDVQVPGDRFAPMPAVDLDMDGDVDVLVEDGYWANDGSGFFAGFTPLFTGRPSDALDLDANGFPDVLTYESTASQIAIQVSQGDGTFAPTVLVTSPDVHFQAKFVDLEPDGDPDVVVGTLNTANEVHLLENVAGVFQPPVTLPVDFSNGNRAFVDDFDGDAVMDLYVLPHTAGLDGVYVFPRTGPGLTYGAPRVFFGRGGANDAGDLDGDGDIDAVGERIHDSWRFNGPIAGAYRQVGAGVPGTGGVAPLLGATGPMRPGSTSASLRVRRGRGGTLFALRISPSGVTPPLGQLTPGTRYQGFQAFPLPGLDALRRLSGPRGVPGAGTADLPFDVPVELAGMHVVVTGVLYDPEAAGFLAKTNRLEIDFGE